MKQLITKFCLSLLIAAVCISCSSSTSPTDNNDNEDPVEEDTTELDITDENFYPKYAEMNLPAPPEGKQWVVDMEVTDEFEDGEFDTTKWKNQLDNWDGRPPGYFVAENVSVSDGKLQISNHWLDEKIEKGDNTYTIGTGAVGSKKGIIFPVYTEARMKANNMPLSSTFWMTTNNHGDLEGCKHYSTELDIIETVGGPYSWDSSIENFNTKLHSNSHFTVWDCDWNRTSYSNGPESVALGYKTHQEYHTYGTYWVDASHAKIYIDGQYINTFYFNDSQKSNPFDLPMHLRMVTETYDWLKPPTKELLEEPGRENTTRYEWVRTYKLEDQ